MKKTIRFDIITIFPESLTCYFQSSILKRAQNKKLISVNIHNLRDFTKDKHRTTDDTAYGGISGMVMKVEPIYRAVLALKRRSRAKKCRVVLLSAKGSAFTQAKAKSLAKCNQVILIAGHYKGVDERVADYVADEEISIGPYVLTGGELPAMVVVDAVSRMIKGVVGDERSKEGESFSTPDIKGEHPLYTRPEVFPAKGGPAFGGESKRSKVWRVPKVLLSGDHKKIAAWRKKHSK